MSITPVKSFAEIKATEEAQTPPPSADELASREPFHVAAIIDGKVVQVFHSEERFAAVLLSSPTFVQCDSPLNGGPKENWSYNATTGVFSA
jgi:hypothetical protein